MAADDRTGTNDVAGKPVGSTRLEQFVYDDKIVRAFVLAIVLWGMCGLSGRNHRRAAVGAAAC